MLDTYKCMSLLHIYAHTYTLAVFFYDNRCECPPGFTGKNCSDNIDDCKSHVCLNGATCVDAVGSYTCMCAPGFSGQFCEIAPVLSLPNYDSATGPGGGACKYHQCQNNAVCYQPKGSPDYMCKCAPGRMLILATLTLLLPAVARDKLVKVQKMRVPHCACHPVAWLESANFCH